MLGQTRVARVIEKWPDFLERWPDADRCAAAPLADLLVVWSGLGYPRRCRNLQLAARQVVDHHRGQVPDDLEDLLALPGVGPYTARAVLAFAYERDVGVVDTNIARVLARTSGRRLTPMHAQVSADAWVPTGTAWLWNQAIMDVGARHCRPAPNCDGCPFEPTCAWRGGAGSELDADPAIGSAGVSTPQRRFEGSDRQLRGRVLAALAAGPTSAVEVQGELCGDGVRARRVIDGLISDGLVVETGEVLGLPVQRWARKSSTSPFT